MTLIVGARSRQVTIAVLAATLFVAALAPALAIADEDNPPDAKPASDKQAETASEVRQHLERGRSLLRSKKTAEALAEAQSALAAMVQHRLNDLKLEMTALGLIRLCLEAMPPREASVAIGQTTLRQVQELHPEPGITVSAAHHQLGRALAALEKHEDAISHFEEALKVLKSLYPKGHDVIATALGNIAGSLGSLGQHKAALARREDAIKTRLQMSRSDRPALATDISNYGVTLSDLGRREDALEAHRAALAMRRRLFPEGHASIAVSLYAVAQVLDGLGRFSEALPKHTEIVVIQRKRHKGDHATVAVAIDNLAYCLAALGRHTEARAHYEEVLLIRRRMAPGDNDGVATTMNNLAGCLEDLGEPREALRLYEAALDMRQRLFRGNHESVATSLNNIGKCLEGLGRHSDAFDRFQQALDMFKALYPDPGDLRVTTVLNNLALCLGGPLARPGEALPLFEGVLKTRQQQFRGDHPETALSLNNLGQCLSWLGRFADALRHYEASLMMYQKVFKGDHPRVAQVLNNVAYAMQDLGRFADAIPYYSRALDMQRRLFGKRDHPAVANTLNNLAYCLREAGRPSEALKKHQDALEMRRRIFPGDHPGVARSLSDLALCLGAIGRLEDAHAGHQDSLAMRRRLFGESHPSVAISLNNLALCKQWLGRHHEALLLYRKAVEIQRKSQAKQHPELATSLGNLGLCLLSVGQYSQALACFEEALAMARQGLEGDHPLVATCLSNLANGLEELGPSDRALELQKEALAMMQRIHGKDHPSIAIMLNNIGLSLGLLNRRVEGLSYYKRALTMRRRLYKGDHVEIVIGLSNAGMCFDALLNPKGALPLFQEAVAMQKRLFPGDHPLTATVLSNLAGCHWLLGRTAGAIPLYEEAFAIARRLETPSRHDIAALLASMKLEVGKPQEAIDLLHDAIARIEIMRRDSRGLTTQESLSLSRRLGDDAGAYSLLVRAYCDQSKVERALDYLEQGRSRVFLAELGRRGRDSFSKPQTSAGPSGQADAAALERVADQLAAAEREEVRTAYVLAHARVRRDLEGAELWSALRKAQAANVAARRKRADLLRQRARLSQDAPLARPRSTKEIQEELSKDSLLLAYQVSEDRAYLLVAPPSGESPKFYLLSWPDGSAVDRRSLGTAIRNYLTALDRRSTARGGQPLKVATTARDLSSGSILFRALVPTVLWPRLARSQSVVLVPHGALHQLPFEALVVRAGKNAAESQYWMDVGPLVSYAPSGSVWLACRERRDAQRNSRPELEVVALGDPRFGGAAGVDSLKPPATGVLVLSAAVDSPGLRAGLRPGDILVQYDNTVASDRAALSTLLEESATAARRTHGAEVDVQLWREGRLHELHAPVGDLGLTFAAGNPADELRRIRRSILQRGLTTERSVRGPQDGLERLPGTRREALAIYKVFAGQEFDAATAESNSRARLLLGAEATEANLVHLAPRARYLHLGTHYVTSKGSQARYSSLVLTPPAIPTQLDDGFLRLIDLVEHWRDRLTGCELAVLSACETHRGPLSHGEGVYALPWGFHVAGCPAVVASLWRVDDESTADLMSMFYESLKSRGPKSKLWALNEARKRLRKTHPDPYYWAPFVFLGDPR